MNNIPNNKKIINVTIPDFRGVFESQNSINLTPFSIWLNNSRREGICWECYGDEFVSSGIIGFLKFRDGISFTKNYSSQQSDLLKGPISYESRQIPYSEKGALFAGKWKGKDNAGKEKEGGFYMVDSAVAADLIAFKTKLAGLVMQNFDKGLLKRVRELRDEFPYAPPSTILV